MGARRIPSSWWAGARRTASAPPTVSPRGLDGRFELVAGAVSFDAARARRSTEARGGPRSHDEFETMAREEAARPEGIEAVSVVTQNHLH